MNFFNSGMGCENTGRIPDVIYHEFGHAVHAHSIIQGAGSFDTSLSEGVSDYLAATTTGDPQMGRGFFFDNRPCATSILLAPRPAGPTTSAKIPMRPA